MDNTETRKIQKDEKLTYALLDLPVGAALEVPYRYYAVPTIRSIATGLKLDKGVEYSVNARGNISATVTRIK